MLKLVAPEMINNHFHNQVGQVISTTVVVSTFDALSVACTGLIPNPQTLRSGLCASRRHGDDLTHLIVKVVVDHFWSDQFQQIQ